MLHSSLKNAAKPKGMKRYQLIGRKKQLTPKRTDIHYPVAHLHLLPYEILVYIFECIGASDTKTLLLVSLTCTKFNSIVNKAVLYHQVKLLGVRSFDKFVAAHIPTINILTRRFLLGLEQVTDPSTKINLIRSLELSNPPVRESENTKTRIAGTYDVEFETRSGRKTEYQEYVTALINILRDSYSLDAIVLSEISPSFAFPDLPVAGGSTAGSLELSSLLLKWRTRPRPQRLLASLTLKPQSGWSIPFRLLLISSFLVVYDSINELVLHNFVIDEAKLQLQSAPSKPIVIDRLTLYSCTFVPSTVRSAGKRKPYSAFQSVSWLTLHHITAEKDLSVIDFIKANLGLRKISIDFASPIFYHPNKLFRFERYNLFFKLLASGHGAYATLKELEFLNFSLLDSYGHLHHIDKSAAQEERDDWVEPPADTFESLLSNVAAIPKLTIVLKSRPETFVTCVNCGITKESQKRSKTLHEWRVLLKPLILANDMCNIEVLAHNHKTLFSKSRSTST